MKFRLLKKGSDGFNTIKDLDRGQSNDVISIKIKTHEMNHDYLCGLVIHFRNNGIIEILSDDLMFKPSASGIPLYYNGVIKASHNSDSESRK